MRHGWIAIACIMLSALLTGCGHDAASRARINAARLETAADDADWPSVGRSSSEQRFSPLGAINADNVARLGLAWSHMFDTDRGLEGTPIVVDDTLYTSTAWSKVFAFDAASGLLKWEFDPKVDGKKGFDSCCDVVSRGVAVWNRKVYVGALDGRLIALDARTGRELWSTQTTDPTRPYTITGAPRVIKGRVMIGNAGAEYGVRGYISAYDAESGRLAWRFYTTPNPDGRPDGAASDKVLAQKAASTWFDGLWKATGGGGTVWDAMAYDPELDLAYFGVGNGAPHDRALRSGGRGDNLFLSSILALRPETGEYVWHYQTTPGESWDYTATQPLMLADIAIEGKPRKVIMQAPKNGFFYVIDRTDGRLISAEPFVPINWASGVDPATGRPIESPGARYEAASSSRAGFLQSPGPAGAHSWHPMAFSPQTGLVYIPAQVSWFMFVPDAKFVYRPGAVNMGLDYPAGIAQVRAAATRPQGVGLPRNELVAWDPVTQSARWRIPQPIGPNAGVLATAGRLLFQGSDASELIAYDAGSGAKLWSAPTGDGVIAAPMTYAVHGEQYVAVLAGPGGGAQIGGMGKQRSRKLSRIVVYKLGGSAALPPDAASPMPPPLDLTGTTSAGDPANGGRIYNQHCFLCHGLAASSPWLANLRRSPMLLSQAGWKTVVYDGALSARGMASFANFVTPGEIEDIRAYVLAQARAAQTQGHPDETPRQPTH